MTDIWKIKAFTHTTMVKKIDLCHGEQRARWKRGYLSSGFSSITAWKRKFGNLCATLAIVCFI
jgi:hypothetical protein